MLKITIFLSICIAATIGLPASVPAPDTFEDAPKPIKVRSFVPGDLLDYANDHSKSENKTLTTGLTTYSSGPWYSLTAEPVPQKNLPIPPGAPEYYRGTKGGHKCFPEDGCYYGFWSLYGPNFVPKRTSADTY